MMNVFGSGFWNIKSVNEAPGRVGLNRCNDRWWTRATALPVLYSTHIPHLEYLPKYCSKRDIIRQLDYTYFKSTFNSYPGYKSM